MPSVAIQWQKELMKMVEFWNVLLCEAKNTSTFNLQAKQHTRTPCMNAPWLRRNWVVKSDILNLNTSQADSQVVSLQYPSQIYSGRNPTKTSRDDAVQIKTWGFLWPFLILLLYLVLFHTFFHMALQEAAPTFRGDSFQCGHLKCQVRVVRKAWWAHELHTYSWIHIPLSIESFRENIIWQGQYMSLHIVLIAISACCWLQG